MGGAIRLGDGRFQLRVPGEFQSPDEIYRLIIGLHDGRPVYLKDVARVVDGFKDEEGRSRLNGHEAVNIAVKKRAGENVIRISETIDTLVEEQRSTWPAGLKTTKLMDHAKDIRIMVADLENNLITGLIFRGSLIRHGRKKCHTGEPGYTLFYAHLLYGAQRIWHYPEHDCSFLPYALPGHARR